MRFRRSRTREQIILRLWQFRNRSRVFTGRSIIRIFGILLVRLDLLDILKWSERLIDFLFFEYLGRFIRVQFKTNRHINARKAHLLAVCFHPSVCFPCRPWGSVFWRDQDTFPARGWDHELPTSSLGCDSTEIDLAFRHGGM